jgi:membrane protein implicated in regulation of membrane protease activity
MSIRVSPISKTAAILIVAIGAFVLFTGLVAEVFASDVAGIAFIALGAFLYWLLYRLTGDFEKKIKAAR